MIKIIQYGLLCGVLMLTACSDSSPPADDATDDATAASDADVADNNTMPNSSSS